MGNVVSQMIPLSYQKGTAVAFAVGLTAVAHYVPSEEDGLMMSLSNLAYLGSFSLWFGMQFWVTFVAGLTKLKILPRHWFGKVQTALFHKFMMGGILLNGTMLSTFIIRHPFDTWKDDTLYMGSGLIFSNIMAGISGLLIEPRVAKHVEDMHKYEKEEGHGDEIGPIKSGSILEDPKYQEMKSTFFKMHGISTALNLVGFVVSGAHLWFLARKLHV